MKRMRKLYCQQKFVTLAILAILIFCLLMLSGCAGNQSKSYDVMNLRIEIPDLLEVHKMEEVPDALHEQQTLQITKKGEKFPDVSLYGMVRVVDLGLTKEEIAEKLSENETMNEYFLKSAETNTEHMVNLLIDDEITKNVTEIQSEVKQINRDVKLLDVTFKADFYEKPTQFRTLKFYNDSFEYNLLFRWDPSLPAKEVKLLDDILASMKLTAK